MSTIACSCVYFSFLTYLVCLPRDSLLVHMNTRRAFGEPPTATDYEWTVHYANALCFCVSEIFFSFASTDETTICTAASNNCTRKAIQDEPYLSLSLSGCLFTCSLTDSASYFLFLLSFVSVSSSCSLMHLNKPLLQFHSWSTAAVLLSTTNCVFLLFFFFFDICFTGLRPSSQGHLISSSSPPPLPPPPVPRSCGNYYDWNDWRTFEWQYVCHYIACPSYTHFLPSFVLPFISRDCCFSLLFSSLLFSSLLFSFLFACYFMRVTLQNDISPSYRAAFRLSPVREWKVTVSLSSSCSPFLLVLFLLHPSLWTNSKDTFSCFIFRLVSREVKKTTLPVDASVH